MMAKEKLAARSEGVRLGKVDSDWLDNWASVNGQSRSLLIRAAVRALRLTVVDLNDLAAVRLIAKLADASEKAMLSQADELWAAAAAAIASRKGKKPGR